MAELLCRVLELLDTTGWNERQVFKSAVLLNDEEWAVPVRKNLNSWVDALNDTPVTATYVITNDICIECKVSDHTTSTCQSPQAFTTLKTRISTAEPPSTTKAEYLLNPSTERFRQVDCGSPSIILLAPNPRTFARMLSRPKLYERSEALNLSKPDRFRNTVYFRASMQSYRGRYKDEATMRSQYSIGSRQDRTISGIDQDSSAHEQEQKSENQSYAKDNQDQHRQNQVSSIRRVQILPKVFQEPHKSISVGATTLVSRGNGPNLVGPTQRMVPYQSLERRDTLDAGELPRPTRPHAISSARDQKLKARDVQGFDLYSTKHCQTHLRRAGESSAAHNSDPRSSERSTRANRSSFGKPLDNMADYAFSDEDDSDTDPLTYLPRANHPVPALSSPGGWL
ncbi:MAG: hypothetical protein Q9226_007997 [Calogaya cf. arnoldii]